MAVCTLLLGSSRGETLPRPRPTAVFNVGSREPHHWLEHGSEIKGLCVFRRCASAVLVRLVQLHTAAYGGSCVVPSRAPPCITVASYTRAVHFPPPHGATRETRRRGGWAPHPYVLPHQFAKPGCSESGCSLSLGRLERQARCHVPLHSCVVPWLCRRGSGLRAWGAYGASPQRTARAGDARSWWCMRPGVLDRLSTARARIASGDGA
jgi:hypothetical protein